MEIRPHVHVLCVFVRQKVPCSDSCQALGFADMHQNSFYLVVSPLYEILSPSPTQSARLRFNSPCMKWVSAVGRDGVTFSWTKMINTLPDYIIAKQRIEKKISFVSSTLKSTRLIWKICSLFPSLPLWQQQLCSQCNCTSSLCCRTKYWHCKIQSACPWPARTCQQSYNRCSDSLHNQQCHCGRIRGDWTSYLLYLHGRDCTTDQ
jgi:hypothetical protein